MLRAAMHYAGAIRLDHVLGLKRLYLVPAGRRPDEGAYVRMPFEPLLALAALESAQHRCIVIGEDLGTVPEGFRDRLREWGLWSYRVMMFERGHDGAFLPPQDYTPDALVTFSTHDLPTYEGWRSGHDIALKHGLGIDPGESGRRGRRRRRCWRAPSAGRRLLTRRSAISPGRVAVMAVPRGPARVVDQAIVQGTVDSTRTGAAACRWRWRTGRSISKPAAAARGDGRPQRLMTCSITSRSSARLRHPRRRSAMPERARVAAGGSGRGR